MSPPPSPSADAPDIAVQVAARLLAEGRADEAAARLTALVTAAPAYPAALVLLARALEASGRDAEALEAWHRAHALVPNSPLVRRERQRLLEAGAAAPPVGPPEAEPEAVAREPQETPPSESLAAAPAGDLPDAHLALTEEEVSAEETPGGEAVEDVQAGEEPASSPEEDAPEEEVEAPLLTQETSAEEEIAAEEDAVEGTDAVEPEPLSAPPEDADEDVPVATPVDEEVVDEEVVDEPGDAPVATAEPPVAPPDVTEPPAEPVAGEPESEAAWWHRTPTAEPPEPQEEEGGWSVLEETEAALPGLEVAEPHIAPPGPASTPPAAPDEDTIEDARVIPAEEAHAPATPDAPLTLADELDALINRLEDAPRIRPDPTFSGPDVSFEEEEEDDDLVSETLARIYAAQRQYAEAAIVYEKLAQQRPGEAEEMLRRAAEMRAQGGA